jgi:hypothetical protein
MPRNLNVSVRSWIPSQVKNLASTELKSKYSTSHLAHLCLVLRGFYFPSLLLPFQSLTVQCPVACFAHNIHVAFSTTWFMDRIFLREAILVLQSSFMLDYFTFSTVSLFGVGSQENTRRIWEAITGHLAEKKENTVSMGEQTIHGWLVPRKHKPDDFLSQVVPKKQMFFLCVSTLVMKINENSTVVYLEH